MEDCTIVISRVHYRNLERDKIYALSAKQGYNYDALMQLSPAAKEELKWWCDNVGHGYRRIQQATYSHSFQVDASDSGWGIACTTDESLHSHWFWSQEQRSLHINFDPTLLGESGLRPSGRSVSGASMVHSNVVHQNCTDANQPAGGDGLDERDESANTPIGSADSKRARFFQVDGLPSIRRYYQMQSFSEHIIITDVLVNSWRPATQKQHKVYIKEWAIFCGIRKIALFSPDLSNMLEFLYTLLNLSYSSLNTARSALSCIVLIDKIPVGQHPVVCCFLEGASGLKPPAHKYYGIWDVNQVCSF